MSTARDIATERQAALAFDLKRLDPGFLADPFPLYRALREYDPIHRMPDGSYFLSRFVAHFQLGEPSSLDDNARLILADNPQYQFATMGHTHNPDQFRKGHQYFFNTGTWIPIIEIPNN